MCTPLNYNALLQHGSGCCVAKLPCTTALIVTLCQNKVDFRDVYIGLELHLMQQIQLQTIHTGKICSVEKSGSKHFVNYQLECSYRCTSCLAFKILHLKFNYLLVIAKPRQNLQYTAWYRNLGHNKWYHYKCDSVDCGSETWYCCENYPRIFEHKQTRTIIQLSMYTCIGWLQ